MGGDRHRVEPPPDYVRQLVASWQKERPDLDVEPLEVVYRVQRLAARFSAAIERTFQGSGISSADFAVLANLRRAGAPYQLSQRALMDRLNLTSGTISVRIDRLAEAGLVRREPDPGDRRGVLVTLTEPGEDLFDALATKHLANEARLVSALSPADRAELARMLQILLVDFEPIEERPDTPLGLTVSPGHVGQQRRSAVGLPPAAGLLVEAVRPGSPAAEAGLEPGDWLISCGNQPLRSLSCLATATSSGRPLQVRYRRREAEAMTTLRAHDARDPRYDNVNG